MLHTHSLKFSVRETSSLKPQSRKKGEKIKLKENSRKTAKSSVDSKQMGHNWWVFKEVTPRNPIFLPPKKTQKNPTTNQASVVIGHLFTALQFEKSAIIIVVQRMLETLASGYLSSRKCCYIKLRHRNDATCIDLHSCTHDFWLR